MTIPSTTRRAGPYIGTGALVSYSFSFKCFDKNDLAVVVATDAGFETDLVIDSSALVTLNADQEASPGGTVQYAVAGVATALPLGYSLVILSALAYSQASALPDGGNYRAEVVENALDALAIQIQQIVEILDRTITLPAWASGVVSAILPAPEAGKALGWDASETSLINLDVGAGTSVDTEGYVTPADYLASGNGVTDDSAALQAMFDDALKIDLGDYTKRWRCNSTVTVRSGTIIRGFGGGRLLQGTRQRPVLDVSNTSGVQILGAVFENAVIPQLVNAGSLVTGEVYSILEVGTTDFTLVGASSNTPGRFFTATGPGTGTGRASQFYNTPNSQDAAIKANYAQDLVVDLCKFYYFAYTTLNMQLWGERPRFTRNLVVGPGADVLNPLDAPDPQIPGFRNCTGVTMLAHGGLIAENVFVDTSEGFIVGQQSTDVVVRNNLVLGTVVEHGGYIDAATQRCVAHNNLVTNTELIGMKVQWYDPLPTPATSILKGGVYVIKTVGTTNWTDIGAASNTVGVQFKATGPGTGTGTATWPVPADNKFLDNVAYNTGGDGFIFLNSGALDVANITNVSQPTKGTASGATTNSAGYAVGATVIGLASAGTGTVLVNDMVRFGNDQNYYRVTSGDSDVSNGGSITIAAPGLLNAIAASATAITVEYSPGVFTIDTANAVAADDWVLIGGVGGMTPVNNAFYVHTLLTSTTFLAHQGDGVPLDTSSFPAYTSGGTVKKPVRARGSVISGNTVHNCGQDAIGLRYLDGGIVEGNVIDTSARAGVYGLYVGNLTIGPNQIANTQINGIYAFTPTDPITIGENQLTNVGAAGNDVGGASSGIFLEGDGGGMVRDNTVRGERTRTKMLNGIHLGSGDKRRWSIMDNEAYDAESAVVMLHGLDTRSLRRCEGNMGTAASGPNPYSGLASALPNAGNPTTDWWSNAAPTSGFWAQGSKVWKLLPDPGDPIGWVCLSSGAPGTWVPFGKVHNVLAGQDLQGTYTPALTNSTNTTILDPRVCNWRIDGNRVIVTGRFNIQATATPTLVGFNMSLPVPSNLTTSSFSTLFGTFASASNQMAGAIYNPGAVNRDTARFECNASTTAQVFCMFQFEYILGPL